VKFCGECGGRVGGDASAEQRTTEADTSERRQPRRRRNRSADAPQRRLGPLTLARRLRHIRRPMDYPGTTSKQVCAVLLALVVGSACGAGLQSRVETPASPKMSGYWSYSWWQPPLNQGPRGYTDDEERLDNAVRYFVENQLSAHGYREDSSGTPDFVVRYGVALYEEPTKVFSDYLSHGADGSGKDMGAARGAPAGTLTLKAVEVSTGRTVWRATTSDVIKRGPSPEQVAPAVRQMMESVPHRD
jgi:hypothetical protein